MTYLPAVNVIKLNSLLQFLAQSLVSYANQQCHLVFSLWPVLRNTVGNGKTSLPPRSRWCTFSAPTKLWKTHSWLDHTSYSSTKWREDFQKSLPHSENEIWCKKYTVLCNANPKDCQIRFEGSPIVHKCDINASKILYSCKRWCCEMGKCFSFLCPLG